MMDGQTFIIREVDQGCLVSHQAFINSLHKDLNMEYLFNIKTPFLMDDQAKARANNLENNRRKRRKNHDVLKVDPIKAKCKKVLEDLHALGLFSGEPTTEDWIENNKSSREKAKGLLSQALSNYPMRDLIGINDSDEVTKLNDRYILPPNCGYYSCDIKDIESNLDQRKFKMILMDPPWENKHVKRHKNKIGGYHMLSNDDLIDKLPIPDLLEDGGIVAIWCTNSQRHLEAIECWLQKWNLVKKATWYWLKITKYGQPITDWTHPHKKPYEQIIIATARDKDLEIENDYVFVSIPSLVHSHKPPIFPLLQKQGFIFPEQKDKCLEIFGRYLLPNCTTYGNQCLLFQDTVFNCK